MQRRKGSKLSSESLFDSDHDPERHGFGAGKTFWSPSVYTVSCRGTVNNLMLNRLIVLKSLFQIRYFISTVLIWYYSNCLYSEHFTLTIDCFFSQNLMLNYEKKLFLSGLILCPTWFWPSAPKKMQWPSQKKMVCLVCFCLTLTSKRKLWVYVLNINQNQSGI